METLLGVTALVVVIAAALPYSIVNYRRFRLERDTGRFPTSRERRWALIYMLSAAWLTVVMILVTWGLVVMAGFSYSASITCIGGWAAMGVALLYFARKNHKKYRDDRAAHDRQLANSGAAPVRFVMPTLLRMSNGEMDKFGPRKGGRKSYEPARPLD